MQLIKIIFFLFFLTNCTISTSQKLVKDPQTKSDVKITISSVVKTGLKINN
jgi:hypothetical protein